MASPTGRVRYMHPELSRFDGGTDIRIRYVFGPFTRAAHWLRFGLIIWFVLSGLYIANPFLIRNVTTPTAFNFLQAHVRGWHVLAGWVLIALTLVRIYEFLFVKRDGGLGLGSEVRMWRVLFDGKAWRGQAAYYLLLRRDHPHFLFSNYGPIQYFVYFVLYVLLVGVSLTGIMLAAPYLDAGLSGTLAHWLDPLRTWLGGLAMVRRVHHWLMWGIIWFSVVHIYMVVWNSVRGRTMELEAMFSGYKAEE